MSASGLPAGEMFTIGGPSCDSALARYSDVKVADQSPELQVFSEPAPRVLTGLRARLDDICPSTTCADGAAELQPLEFAEPPVVVAPDGYLPETSGDWHREHIRAVCGWPLGDPARHSDAIMRNLLGEEALDWQSPAATPQTCVHLYGKLERRQGRKMGHVTKLYPMGQRPAH